MDQVKDAGSKRNLCMAGQSHSRNVVDTRTAEKEANSSHPSDVSPYTT